MTDIGDVINFRKYPGFQEMERVHGRETAESAVRLAYDKWGGHPPGRYWELNEFHVDYKRTYGFEMSHKPSVLNTPCGGDVLRGEWM